MSLYAIVETGSKQYLVEPKSVIEVELLESAEKQIILDRVLLVSKDGQVEVGAPLVKGAKVICENLGDFRDKKVFILKYKRRKNYRRKKGHRQDRMRLEVKDIKF